MHEHVQCNVCMYIYIYTYIICNYIHTYMYTLYLECMCNVLLENKKMSIFSAVGEALMKSCSIFSVASERFGSNEQQIKYIS